jgi:hypothetical protein
VTDCTDRLNAVVLAIAIPAERSEGRVGTAQGHSSPSSANAGSPGGGPGGRGVTRCGWGREGSAGEGAA